MTSFFSLIKRRKKTAISLAAGVAVIALISVCIVKQLEQAKIRRDMPFKKAVIDKGYCERLDKVLTKAELTGLSSSELRIVRNTVFARYGYCFKSEDLQKHFRRFDWYRCKSQNVDAAVTAVDKKNIALIQQRELFFRNRDWIFRKLLPFDRKVKDLGREYGRETRFNINIRETDLSYLTLWYLKQHIKVFDSVLSRQESLESITANGSRVYFVDEEENRQVEAAMRENENADPEQRVDPASETSYELYVNIIDLGSEANRQMLMIFFNSLCSGHDGPFEHNGNIIEETAKNGNTYTVCYHSPPESAPFELITNRYIDRVGFYKNFLLLVSGQVFSFPGSFEGRRYMRDLEGAEFSIRDTSEDWFRFFYKHMKR